MNLAAVDPSILGPAFVTGVLVIATHVPLGIHVLSRGIVFIDLAIAQIAGLGVIFADWLGLEPLGLGVQAAALSAAFTGALFLTWTERRWHKVQEAIIGTTFVLAATGALILLAANPRGGEHLKELLVGQILWVNWPRLLSIAMVYAIIVALWFGLRERMGRMGFYLLFAGTVTISVQLVGLYLVFASLIIPALATHQWRRARIVSCYALGVGGYAVGLFVSAVFDLPAGAVIVWALALLAIPAFALHNR
jgi:zinc/manganese transport system permease protein